MNIYTFTIKTNGQTGFAIATGDKRIAQVLVYVKNGAISDTTEIPAMAFMIRGIKTSLKRTWKSITMEMTIYQGMIKIGQPYLLQNSWKQNGQPSLLTTTTMI